jgi:hypothetical protein
VRSPARPPGAIGVERPCANIVIEWRTSSTKAIRLNTTREERTELTGVKGERGGASSIGLEKEWGRWSGPVWRRWSSGGPFIGAREGGGRRDDNADELAMLAVMAQTATGWLGQARGEGTARVQWRGGS